MKKILSIVLLVVNLLLASFLLVMSVCFLIVVKVIPAFIFLLIIDFGIFMLAYHYDRCRRYLKREGNPDEKRRKRIHAVNTVIIFIARAMAIGMTAGLIYMCFLFRTFAELQIFVLLVDMLSLLYLVSTVLIDKKITVD